LVLLFELHPPKEKPKNPTVFQSLKIRPNPRGLRIEVYSALCLNNTKINLLATMLNPGEAWEGSFANVQQLKDYRQAVQALQPALQKPHDHRNHADQTAIHGFLELSPYFKQLAVQVSQEIARDIVRASKVYVVQGRKRIFEKGDRLQRMILPLLGNFFTNQLEEEAKEERFMQDHFDELIDNATIQVPLKKKTTSLERRMTMLMENTDIFSMSIHQK
jgi:hypothetical protein